jgi:hypothetical protein
VVRRRAQPTLDRAYEIVLAEMPVELSPLIIRYVDNMREGIEIRSTLTTAMTRANLRWTTVDQVARSLLTDRLQGSGTVLIHSYPSRNARCERTGGAGD